jgi:hypothetical protein
VRPAIVRAASPRPPPRRAPRPSGGPPPRGPAPRPASSSKGGRAPTGRMPPRQRPCPRAARLLLSPRNLRPRDRTTARHPDLGRHRASAGTDRDGPRIRTRRPTRPRSERGGCWGLRVRALLPWSEASSCVPLASPAPPHRRPGRVRAPGPRSTRRKPEVPTVGRTVYSGARAGRAATSGATPPSASPCAPVRSPARNDRPSGWHGEEHHRRGHREAPGHLRVAMGSGGSLQPLDPDVHPPPCLRPSA